MAIRSGQILFQGGEYVIDRIQSGGVGNVNIPEEKINEVGNFETVATVRDTPDLSFDVESLDMSTEFEEILLGIGSSPDGHEFNFDSAVPLDILSEFKSTNTTFDITRSVAVPFLNLESMTYRFGVGQNSTQSFTLRGDSIFYIPGTAYYQIEAVTAGSNQVYTLDNTAIEYVESGDSYYTLSAVAVNSTNNKSKRLFLGTNYTNTTTNITVIDDLDADGYDQLRLVYGSATNATYSQTGNNPNGDPVHEGVGVKPAAIRSKDIDLYVGDTGATPTFSRWTSVQSVEVSRRANLENEQEFGNSKFVATTFDTADVTGSVTIQPQDPEELFGRISEITGVATNKVAGVLSSVALPVEMRINHPDTGAALKTLYVPDARFQPPNHQAQVDQNYQNQLSFTSDSGVLKVYKGSRP